jgi:hypothetical protein
MTSTFLFILRFYLPLLIALVLVCLVVFSPKVRIATRSRSKPVPAEIEVKFLFLGISIPLGVWLKKVWIIRTLLVATALSLVVTTAGTNFIDFLPQRLEMDVYFDPAGLKRTLSTFSREELTDLGVSPDWEQYVERYDAAVRDSLTELWERSNRTNRPALPTIIRSYIHGRGETTILAERVGVFVYRITESRGLLKFDVDAPRSPQSHFATSFTLLETANNHIRPKLSSLLTAPSLVLRPEFKQILSIDDGLADASFDHVVIGATKIRLLPFPEFGDTVYLWKSPIGKSVPVAYAVYF